jgi:hypothetical protein
VNNREKATVIWLAVAVAAALCNREIRAALWAVVKAFAHPKIVGPLVAFAGWTIALVVLAHLAGLWDADVRNDTVTWFITAGFAMFLSASEVTEDRFVRTVIRRSVAVTAFVETFANLKVFGLVVELILVPVLVFVGAMAVVAETKEEFAPVRRIVNVFLTVFGSVILIYVVVRLLGDFDVEHTARALALPVWLTLGSLPFIYPLGLTAEYEQAFLRIDHRAADPIHRRRAKRALLRTAHVQAVELRGFAGHWISDLTATGSDAEARTVMRRWRAAWRSEEREEQADTARAFTEGWLSQEDPALAEVHADALRRHWERLDSEQRTILKADALGLASSDLVDEVVALPD